MTEADVLPPARGTRASRDVWALVAAGLVLLAVQLFGPPPAQGPAMALIAVIALIALYVGPRRYLATADRTPWRHLQIASYLFMAASVLRVAVPSTMATPPTSMALIPNVLVVPAYFFIGYSFVGMLRRRRAAEDDPARIDAVLVGLAAAFLTWTFIVAPAVVDANMNPIRVIDAFFPIIDVVLLVLVSQLMLAGGVRQPSLWLMVVAALAMFAGDLLFVLRNAELVAFPQQHLDALFALIFVMLPASALHPSMRTLTEPRTSRSSR